MLNENSIQKLIWKAGHLNFLLHPKNTPIVFLDCKIMAREVGGLNWVQGRWSSVWYFQKHFWVLKSKPKWKLLFRIWKTPEQVYKRAHQKYFELKLSIVHLIENWSRPDHWKCLTVKMNTYCWLILTWIASKC